jgi:hypothetical protein
MRRLLLLAMLVGVCGAAEAKAADVATRRKLASAYDAPADITRGDWELLQVNILWMDAYPTFGDYLKSSPMVFDRGAGLFRADLLVNESRGPGDREPFSKLTQARQRAVLDQAIGHLRRLLGNPFPEVKTASDLVVVQFWSYSDRGEKRLVAKHEDGVLRFLP